MAVPISLRLLFCRLQGPAFIIVVKNGQVSGYAGAPNNRFLAECKKIIEQNNITAGFIYSMKGRFALPVLKASGEIPAPVLQQLRNVANF